MPHITSSFAAFARQKGYELLAAALGKQHGGKFLCVEPERAVFLIALVGVSFGRPAGHGHAHQATARPRYMPLSL